MAINARRRIQREGDRLDSAGHPRMGYRRKLFGIGNVNSRKRHGHHLYVCHRLSCITTYAFGAIGLDPPLWYYLPRLLWRTFTRLLGLTPPCAEGCVERWSEVFSRQGIVWFCVTNHAVARTKFTGWLSRMDVRAGGKMRRLDESRGELAAWKGELERHIRQA